MQQRRNVFIIVQPSHAHTCPVNDVANDGAEPVGMNVDGLVAVLIPDIRPDSLHHILLKLQDCFRKQGACFRLKPMTELSSRIKASTRVLRSHAYRRQCLPGEVASCCQKVALLKRNQRRPEHCCQSVHARCPSDCIDATSSAFCLCEQLAAGGRGSRLTSTPGCV